MKGKRNGQVQKPRYTRRNGESPALSLSDLRQEHRRLLLTARKWRDLLTRLHESARREATLSRPHG